MIIKCSITQAVLEFCGLNISVHMFAYAGWWSPAPLPRGGGYVEKQGTWALGGFRPPGL